MSRPEDDPLARLPRQDIPEPDPARMHAAIEASTELFAREIRKHGRETPAPTSLQRLREWLARPSRWAMPVAAGAMAAVAAVFIVPNILTDPTGFPADEKPAPSVPMAESRPDAMAPPPPTAPAPRDESAPAERARTAMRAPMARAPAAEAVPLERYDFDGLELGVRNMPEAAETLLLDGGREERVDISVKDRSERISLFDAFRETGPDGGDLLVLRSGMGWNQRWDVFVRDNGRYQRSIEMSRRIQGATSRDDVRSRLQASQP
ncbi:hypothetical protein [Terrihabitans sp. B22-R8]|uniref:hypothetical protein n=1 Tax=Terrihabitans sp. B22-R8 TaxID=3425128 RepID=UPI00403D0D08